MKGKRLLGIVFVIAGLVLLGCSSYIRSQVEQGKVEISSGQRKVDTANSMFNMTPATKPVGQAFTSGAQSKINAGQGEVDYYEQMARSLLIGGVVLIVVGAIVFVLGLKKKRA
jgi:hypothetical protein